MSSFDPRALRDAFGAFVTGVTVVTAHDTKGQPLGFTANSFSSVSLDPPLLLVCLANTSRSYGEMKKASGFAVNILSEGQKDISNTFARPVEDRFEHVDWMTGPHGAPILADVSAWFDCSVHKIVDAGDHAILIGQVEAFDATPAPGLGYARGAYVTPSSAADALDHSTNLVVSALIERAGQVLLVDDGAGGLTLPEATVGKRGASATLAQIIASTGLSAEPGFVYSVFEDADKERQHISFLCNAAQGDPENGRFKTLTEDVLIRVNDSALLNMLQRFAAESRLGNYGVYFGNQKTGQVRPITSGS